MGVLIADYDPSWPRLFEREKDAILGVLGERLVAIEHHGSTAVPGLGAKPIIDVMAAAAQLVTVDTLVEPLASIGYVFFPNAKVPDGVRYFKRFHSGVEVAHLHVTEYGSPFWERQLLFRDYLRTHPKEAADYERLKRELAPRFPATGPFGPFRRRRPITSLPSLPALARGSGRAQPPVIDERGNHPSPSCHRGNARGRAAD